MAHLLSRTNNYFSCHEAEKLFRDIVITKKITFMRVIFCLLLAMTYAVLIGKFTN